jgi:hypothetical protein
MILTSLFECLIQTCLRKIVSLGRQVDPFLPRGAPKVSADMKPKASVLVINIMRQRMLSMNKFNRYCDSVTEHI